MTRQELGRELMRPGHITSAYTVDGRTIQGIMMVEARSEYVRFVVSPSSMLSDMFRRELTLSTGTEWHLQIQYENLLRVDID